MQAFYENFFKMSVSEPFTVTSGVRQGCILSPIHFLKVIDWVQRQTTADKKRGIKGTMFSNLEDLDFADDLTEISGNIHIYKKRQTD